MRIGCLQFAPTLGNLAQNIQRAEAILRKAAPQNLDLLVLPEMAFSGYNFKSLSEISPHLEASATGPSVTWASSTARRLNCYVTVGYPEIVRSSEDSNALRYNSAIMVSPSGTVVANYRKHHLYTTDESWADEGGEGFFADDVPALGRVAIGICMDLNPYRYIAPFLKYEFATHVLASSAVLVLIPMAWLTNEPPSSIETNPEAPDINTLRYWCSRLEPLLQDKGRGQEVLIVLCNRSGMEGDVCYAGTSAVLGIRGEVRSYGILGMGEEELLLVDTQVDTPSLLQ